MPRLAEIERRIQVMDDLDEIVNALRSVAATRVREAERSFAGIDEYRDAVRLGIARATSLLGTPLSGSIERPRALVVLCSEHGFVGGYNDRLLEAAAAEVDPTTELWVLGTRGVTLARERDLPVAWSRAAPTRVEAVLQASRAVTSELYERIGAGAIASAQLLIAGDGSQPSVLTVVPPQLDPGALPAQEATSWLDPVDLLEAVLAEYVLAEVTRAVMQAFTQENEARLQTMQAAHRYVTDRLGQLHQQAHHQRQEEITAELLDLIAGTMALDVS